MEYLFVYIIIGLIMSVVLAVFGAKRENWKYELIALSIITFIWPILIAYWIRIFSMGVYWGLKHRK